MRKLIGVVLIFSVILMSGCKQKEDDVSGTSKKFKLTTMMKLDEFYGQKLLEGSFASMEQETTFNSQNILVGNSKETKGLMKSENGEFESVYKIMSNFSTKNEQVTGYNGKAEFVQSNTWKEEAVICLSTIKTNKTFDGNYIYIGNDLDEGRFELKIIESETVRKGKDITVNETESIKNFTVKFVSLNGKVLEKVVEMDGIVQSSKKFKYGLNGKIENITISDGAGSVMDEVVFRYNNGGKVYEISSKHFLTIVEYRGNTIENIKIKGNDESTENIDSNFEKQGILPDFDKYLLMREIYEIEI